MHALTSVIIFVIFKVISCNKYTNNKEEVHSNERCSKEDTGRYENKKSSLFRWDAVKVNTVKSDSPDYTYLMEAFIQKQCISNPVPMSSSMKFYKY